MRPKSVKTYFDGEGAVAKHKKKLSKDEWRDLMDKFPDGIPKRRRFSDERPQRSLHVYFIRRSTTEAELRALFVNFGAVMNVFIERENNGAYVVFATTEEAKAAKKALDGVMSFDGEHIAFILRRVDIWKEANRRQLRICLQKAFGRLIVDFSAVPDLYRARLAPVPALHRARGSASRKRKAAKAPPNDTRLATLQSSMASWLKPTSTLDTVEPTPSEHTDVFLDDGPTVVGEATRSIEAEVLDDYWDDSPEVIGEWAKSLEPAVRDDYWDDSPEVIGEWAKSLEPAVHDDYWDDSPEVIGEWAKSGVRAQSMQPVNNDDFWDDSPDVIGEWGQDVASATTASLSTEPPVKHDLTDEEALQMLAVANP